MEKEATLGIDTEKTLKVEGSIDVRGTVTGTVDVRSAQSVIVTGTVPDGTEGIVNGEVSTGEGGQKAEDIVAGATSGFTVVVTNVGGGEKLSDIYNAAGSNVKNIVLSAASDSTVLSGQNADVALVDGRSLTLVGFKYSGTVTGNGAAAKFTNVTGQITLTAGSIVVNGVEASGSITDVKGEVKISGSFSGSTTITMAADATAENTTITFVEDVSIAAGTFAVNGKATVKALDGVKILNNGTLSIGEGAVIASDLSIVGGTVGIVPSMAGYDLTLENVTKVTTALVVKDLEVEGTLNIVFEKQVDAANVSIACTGKTEFKEALAVSGKADISAGVVSVGVTTVSGTGTTVVPSSIVNLVLEDEAELKTTGDKRAVIAGEAAGTLEGKFAVSAGSTLTITGTNDSADILNNGSVYIGTAQDKQAFVKTLTNKGTAVVYGTVETLTNEKTVRLYGGITGGENKAGATIHVMDKAASVGTVGGAGTVDISAITETVKISGSIAAGKTEYAIYQTVVIAEDTEIKAGAVVIIRGNLVINEGVTVTIDDGASLVAAGSVAVVTNNGSVAVDSDGNNAVSGSANVAADAYAGLQAEDNAQIVNNGAVALAYSPAKTENALKKVMAIQNGAIFKNNGTIVVGAESNLVVGAADSDSTPNVKAGMFDNAAGASLTIQGKATGAIVSAGSVVVSSSVEQKDLSISLSGASAAVGIERIVGTLTVDDESYEFKSNKTDAKGNDRIAITMEQDGDKDSFAGGLSIAVGTHSYKNAGGKTPKDSMLVLAGALTVSVSKTNSAAYATMAIAGEGKRAAELGDLTIGAVTVAKDGSFKATAGETGTIVISGSLTAIGSDVHTGDSASTPAYAGLEYEGAFYVVAPEAAAVDQTRTYRYVIG